MSRRLSRSELLGTEPLWLLTVYWAGRTYRFASFPTVISSDDGSLQFRGGLELGEFHDALPRSGVVQDGGEASVSVVFPLNVAQEYLQRRPLEAASCELAMVLHKEGRPQQDWDGRYVQLVGQAQRPQFGWPEREVGWAAFTVSAKLYDNAAPVLDPAWKITSATWQNHNANNSDGITGAAYPLVFGTPGDTIIPGSPAYLVDTTGSTKFLISVGRVEATSVVIWDETGLRDNTATVDYKHDGRGVLCSYIKGSSILTFGFNKSGGKHYVGWTSNGGGILNPFGSGVLTKGGDLTRYLLNRNGLDTEAGAWLALAPILNRFEFSGYINDPTITTWQFLRDEILKFLPIRVRIGSDGAYPVSLLPVLTPGELPALEVGEAAGLEQLSPLEVTTQMRDVINSVGIDYYYNAREDRYTRDEHVTPDLDISDRYRLSSVMASGNIHGTRKGSAMEAGYVYDDSTARQILRWKMIERGFLSMSVIIAARSSWGWLHVGDQVALTISRLGISGHRAMVVSKVWDRGLGRWRFEVSLSLTSAEHNL